MIFPIDFGSQSIDKLIATISSSGLETAQSGNESHYRYYNNANLQLGHRQ